MNGVRYRQPDGTEHELQAALTVGCDGRASDVRSAAGLVPREFGTPMDVWWFRLPRRDADPVGAMARFSTGHLMVMLDRGDYWQCAYLIGKGSDVRLRADGLPAFQHRLVGLLPWLSDRVDALDSWDAVKLLTVRLDRLRRWYRDGLLCIGDAAHAMSPVGGVGINLAVQDAVAAATKLAQPLRTGTLTVAQLAAVQRRRWLPAYLTQAGQQGIHRVVLAPTLSGQRRRPTRPQLPVRLMQRFPLLQAVPGSLVAIGVLPEHVPTFARRDLIDHP